MNLIKINYSSDIKAGFTEEELNEMYTNYVTDDDRKSAHTNYISSYPVLYYLT